MKKDYPAYISRLHNYYIEFLSRSKLYQEWLKQHNNLIQELKETPLKLIPTRIIPNKKNKPINPQEINKPAIHSSMSRKDQYVWNITNKFRGDLNRVILEINIEKPIEILKTQCEEIIRIAQERYWHEMKNENWFGEYRFLIDFKRDRTGRLDTYPFEEWDRYLKVYDLKIDGKLYSEIAQKMFNSKNEDAIDKVKKAFKKAKILISAAEENRFPPQKR